MSSPLGAGPANVSKKLGVVLGDVTGVVLDRKNVQGSVEEPSAVAALAIGRRKTSSPA